MYSIENGLFMHMVSVQEFQYELFGRFRLSLSNETLAKYNPAIENDNIIKLKDLSRGVILILIFGYLFALILLINENFPIPRIYQTI